MKQKHADLTLKYAQETDKTLEQPSTTGLDETACSASLTLDEFIFHQLKLLENFESSWRELHRDDEELYPLEMFAGDWLEQLGFWREHEDLSLPNETSAATGSERNDHE